MADLRGIRKEEVAMCSISLESLMMLSNRYKGIYVRITAIFLPSYHELMKDSMISPAYIEYLLGSVSVLDRKIY